MNTNEAHQTFNRLQDGQEISVTTKSGRVFKGIYAGEHSDPDTFLHFETFEGQELKAEWANVEGVGFASAQAVAGRMYQPNHTPILALPRGATLPGTDK